MARAQSQYLRIFDTAGVTYIRWQSYYVASTVSANGTTWSYVPFIADGFTAGISGDEAAISVTAPATRPVMSAFEGAIKAAQLVELLIYQFDPQDGNTEPQVGQVLVGSYVGQVVGGSGGLTSITIQLGSALSPVGAQIPPRKFTTSMMGVGCRL
jgi:hypothetical protein